MPGVPKLGVGRTYRGLRLKGNWGIFDTSGDAACSSGKFAHTASGACDGERAGLDNLR